jgi:hypothetical protein
LSIDPPSTSSHPDEDCELEHPEHIKLEHRDMYSGRLHRVDVSRDIDAQAHAIMLHLSRPKAAPVYPRHSDALDLVSKTMQGRNGTMT